ncbi:MAG TPA: capsule assembly Wzi family protein [Steroidobacteraceae bacterium]|nr:capsule assembly Wzi family protein [Steroidobacteraceae bacterium]
MIAKTIVFTSLALLAVGTAAAQGFFLPAGDARLRDDLTLLVDEGVINLPLSEWPLARIDVADALAVIDGADLADPALRQALVRVRAAAAPHDDAATWRIRELRLTAGQPGLLRDEATLGRENGELTSSGGAMTDRYNIKLTATGVLDASDGQDIRFDGSDITVRWGNWLFSANQMDRWWGPGRDGNLILSNNARPMPALSLDRMRSLPVDLPVVRLLGPWRFSGFLGLMENERSDVDRPVFMGMRLSFKPAPIFEFGMSRSAQFCGKGRRCGLRTLGRVLIGRDNVGIRGLEDPDQEPGNQMAGFDARIVSPFKPLPVAVHAQLIGEDNSSTGIPERYLGLFGGEMWFMLGTGSVLRAHVEYANTKVKWYNSDVEYDVAYTQTIFHEGYRYRGRNIGHTTDGDSETASVMLSLTTGEGHRWAALARRGRLDRCCVPGANSLITNGPSDYKSGQISWEGGVRGHRLGIQLGYEKQTPTSAGDADGVFGFLQWRKSFDTR